MTSTIPQPFQSGFALQDGSKLNEELAKGNLGVSNGLVATGTDIDDALQLATPVNQLATVAASTGVKLNSAFVQHVIFNDGASAVNIFAADGATIDGIAGATGVTLANGARGVVYQIAPRVFVSALLGAAV